MTFIVLRTLLSPILYGIHLPTKADVGEDSLIFLFSGNDLHTGGDSVSGRGRGLSSIYGQTKIRDPHELGCLSSFGTGVWASSRRFHGFCFLRFDL